MHRENHPAIPPATDAAYPLRPGNRVRPLIDGQNSFRRIAAAIAAATHSVWLTIAFYAEDFRFPDGGATLFDMLDRAAARGLDIRALVWRPNPDSAGYGRTFPGTPADHDTLRRRGARFAIRWDRAPAAFCQHQKSWLLDAGRPSETAFVGGINLTAQALHRHDLYVEITGPSATDIHHNFVQRWNEASERDTPGGVWGAGGAAPLPWPTRVSAPRGDATVQVQRMVPPGRIADSHATPGGRPFPIASGERSILEQYERAIDAARDAILIANQALPIPPIALRLDDALSRGVAVALIVPAHPEAWVRAARRDPSRAPLFDAIERLARHDRFALIGLSDGPDIATGAIYVHAKIMLVDDRWATIGSCNLHANSLGGHTEMNAAIWDSGTVRTLRRDLLAAHIAEDTTPLDAGAALRRLRAVAAANRDAIADPRRPWQGRAVALDPARYAG